MERGEKWLRQALDDLEWLADSLAGKHFAQSWFVAQQVAEKALKAIAYSRGTEIIKTHSILALAKALKVNGEIEKAAQVLDQYYMTTRYPDALPDGYPGEFFTPEQASEAMRLATLVLARAQEEIPL